MIICELCNYSAKYPGNFIHSLFNLEKHLSDFSGQGKKTDNKLIYVFFTHSADLPWAKDMIKNGKTVYFVSPEPGKMAAELTYILRQQKVDLLHIHFYSSIVMLFLVKIRNTRVKIVMHLHNQYEIPPNKLKAWLKRTFYQSLIDWYCACGKSVYEKLIAAGFAPEKSTYIDNCIDFSRFEPLPEVTEKANDYGNKKLLTMFGTHFYRKGCDIALKALKNIAENENILLLIICANEGETEKELAKYLPEKPCWLSLAPVRSDVQYYYGQSAIFLTPSRDEGLCYAIPEAIFCGTPVIRSQIPSQEYGIPEDFSVPSDNPAALEERILQVLHMPQDNLKLILARQKEYVVKNCSVDTWGTKTLAFYRQILEK